MQLRIPVMGIFLEQVSHFLLRSFCCFLSDGMYLLPLDPPLLSELCLRSTSNFATGTFLGPTVVHTMDSIHRREIPAPSQLPCTSAVFLTSS